MLWKNINIKVYFILFKKSPIPQKVSRILVMLKMNDIAGMKRKLTQMNDRYILSI
jgi:hypothetical protein